MLPTVKIRRGHEGSLKRRHPWVFSGAVERAGDAPPDGAAVRVLAPDGTCLGIGHYQARGSIRVRMLAWEDREPDLAFWRERLAAAWSLREAAGLAGSAQTTAFRLVHGEGDGLSGLVADWYDGYVVLQPHSAGMHQAADELAAALRAELGDRVRAVRLQGHLVEAGAGAGQEGPEPGASLTVLENGLRFTVAPGGGQKTGLYLDQRENRALAARYAAGRRVLDVFSYCGGFAMHALRAGAQAVLSVDGSEAALAAARHHAALNGFEDGRFSTQRADAMDFMKDPPAGFDMVILDPPAFAKHLSARHGAIQAYRRLNAMAMRRIERGGMLFTFSCSQVVTPDLFRGAVLAAAVEVGRPVQLLHVLGQPPDHPVSLGHPECEYLKGLALRVC